jgi:putative tricarboxylic transport membrane protein
MSGVYQLLDGFAVALSWKGLLYCFIGCLWGTIVGVLPGLGPLAGMTLLLPLTFGLDPTTGIIMLTGIFYGAMYGGSTTSILVRIPGEAASVVTCIDGYEMARKGRAGPALTIAALGSFVGGTVSILGLMFIAPPLAKVMIAIGPSVEVVLILIALGVIAVVSAGSRIKTATMIALGLLLGTVGLDHLTGAPRFTFGHAGLTGGLSFAALAIGLFGLSEILMNLERTETIKAIKPRLKELIPRWKDLKTPHPRSDARRSSDSSSGSSRASAMWSRPSCPMRSRSGSPSIPRSSARARSPALRDPRPPTMPSPAPP